jgi:hypothetical protein
MLKRSGLRTILRKRMKKEKQMIGQKGRMGTRKQGEHEVVRNERSEEVLSTNEA